MEKLQIALMKFFFIILPIIIAAILVGGVLGLYDLNVVFGWIGEMRAEGRSFFQVVAYLSPCSDSVETVSAVFGCSNLICIGERILPDADVFRAVSPKTKFLQTAELCEKYAFKRSVVYFNSREEAGSFAKFLEGRGTRCAYIDGALSPEGISWRVTASDWLPTLVTLPERNLGVLSPSAV